eukprot:CAMPEP_0198143468 /NCGR_PEP_ID=MMETSP1443-20131203/7762_1 /TAXON_ID=186043 /ORGANISM="Entomoneis sp., Strain CCMP2396" /LENGTH=259 /DNA_ID=CAMNT_0043806707 /DNA_START=113 /DNA_END=892 /DNA_ORIENTATION=-
MAAAFIHSLVQSGGLAPVVIEDATFPGGEFVYKETKRDYAASASLEKSIAKKDLEMKAAEYIDHIYTLYLDDPNKMGGRRQRFASGLLITTEEEMRKKELLLSTNEGRKPVTEEDIKELGAIELWPRLPYQAATLPSVKAATVQFASTGGFVSSIVLSLKILPTLRKYAKEHAAEGSPVTIISTCSTIDNVCTHYAPLVQGEKFLLGHPESDKYLEGLEPEETINFTGIFESAQKYIPPFKWIADYLEINKDKSESDEL